MKITEKNVMMTSEYEKVERGRRGRRILNCNDLIFQQFQALKGFENYSMDIK